MKIPLHGAGTAFLSGQLKEGDHLAEALLRLPLEQGMTYTFLPPQLNAYQISLLYGGTSQLASGEEIREPFFQFFLGYLGSSPGRAAVFELGAVDRRKPSLRIWPEDLKVMTCRSSLHRIFEGPGHAHEIACDSQYGLVTTADENALRQLVRFARPFPRVGLLTSLPTGIDCLPNRSDVDQSLLNALAAATQHIIVDAYDGEAFAVWSRSAQG